MRGFGCPLHFKQSTNQLRLDSEVLDQPLRHSDTAGDATLASSLRSVARGPRPFGFPGRAPGPSPFPTAAVVTRFPNVLA